ncbi:MAG: RluA family pseudouridine synthase [Bacteroidetes bacterium]|nr:MAG: RluA family pseudouridine synthase [Bacteroidota bacterium]
MRPEEDKEEEKEISEEREELYEHYSFTADPGQEVVRIDKFLLDRLPNTSRNKIQNAAKNGNVVVNDRAVKQNYKVKPGDRVSLVLPYPVREIELIPQDIPLDILFEDDELIVLNKEADMVVHPGYGNYTGTLVNALVYHFEHLPESKDDYFGRPGLVHRLDKHTTGIMVVAKTENALVKLAKQFYDRTTERRYHALVWGDPEADEGRIEGHIGRSLKNRKVMAVFPEGDHGKYAATNYRVIKRFGLVTLVECKLETGRTHQIRVHMKHIGHPLFHDLEYGGDRMLKGIGTQKYKAFIENCFSLLSGQALHAKTLAFDHPTTGKRLSFNSELPEAFHKVLKKWDKYSSETHNFSS